MSARQVNHIRLQTSKRTQLHADACDSNVMSQATRLLAASPQLRVIPAKERHRGETRLGIQASTAVREVVVSRTAYKCSISVIPAKAGKSRVAQNGEASMNSGCQHESAKSASNFS